MCWGGGAGSGKGVRLLQRGEERRLAGETKVDGGVDLIRRHFVPSRPGF